MWSLGALATASRSLSHHGRERALVIPINSTAGSIEGSKRAAIRERELKLRAAYEDGDFERYKELAIVTWPTIVGGVPKETKH